MNIFDPLTHRLARRFNRPTSRETRARPMMATVVILLSPLIPYSFYFGIFLGMELWFLFLVRYLPAMIARRYLYGRNLISVDRVVQDTRLMRRGLAWLLISAICLLVPVQGYIIFAVFHSDLDRLAQRVPPTPVTYTSFGAARIGPFEPNGVARFPHWLEIGLGGPGVGPGGGFGHYPYGTIFIVEDDPVYVYDNFWLWHIWGKWYVQYRS